MQLVRVVSDSAMVIRASVLGSALVFMHKFAVSKVEFFGNAFDE